MNKGVSLMMNCITSAMHRVGVDICLCRSIGHYDNKGLTLINIGAGDWECKGWTNLDYSSQWYSRMQNRHSYKEYDIRKDNIPYEDDSVDCIYCSHVIEHIEDSFDEKMFKESYRVLKRGGVFRITCPDAEYLWTVTKQGKDYWVWRKQWCKQMEVDYSMLRPVDLLVREVATPRMRGYGYLFDEKSPDYQENFENMEMNEFLNYITYGLEFNPNRVGDHINYWHFEKLSKSLKKAGFRSVIRSIYNGSISPFMKSRSFFDKTNPCMSMYIEAIK